MALELFKPFIFNKLEKEGLVPSVKVAREWHEQERPEVWDYLEEVVREHPIFLNRAPTLHRLGIQAFEPILVEGKAIQIHPLVCAAFNADFDGDQMAVHIPLSVEAQIEAQTLMLSTNNILSPAHGRPLTIPSQDMVLGCYYLTLEKKGLKGEGRIFGTPEAALLAMESGEVALQSIIKLRFSGPFMNLATYYDDQGVMTCPIQDFKNELVETTPGRIIFNDVLPKGFPFVNGVFRKKGMENLVFYTYLKVGLKETVRILDALKELGFTYATRAGFSLGIDDFVIPGEKKALVEKAEKEVLSIENLYRDGTISSGERFNRVIEIWGTVTDKVSSAMIDEMKRISLEGKELNPLLRHVRLRLARQQAADPPAGRDARPDVEALGRDPGDAHRRQPPRGPERPPVLHLDPRRPQGPGRHGPQDGQLRLPDPQARRRLPGGHRRRARLRHAQGHQRLGHRRERRDHRALHRPDRRPHRPRAGRPPRHGRDDRRHERGDHREGRPGVPEPGHRAGQDPLGPDLRVQARHLPALLRPHRRPPARWSSSARPAASSPPSRSASPAPS